MEVIRQLNFSADEKGSAGAAVQSISCLCYSLKYKLYFACSKDHKLIVYNEHLNKVHFGGQQSMPVGLVEHISFWDHRDANDFTGGQLFVGGKEGCFIIDLEIRFGYAPAMAIMLDPKGRSIGVEIRRPRAIKAGPGTGEGAAAEDDSKRAEAAARASAASRHQPTEQEQQELKQALVDYIMARGTKKDAQDPQQEQLKHLDEHAKASQEKQYKAILPFLATINPKWSKDTKLIANKWKAWKGHKSFVDQIRDSLTAKTPLQELMKERKDDTDLNAQPEETQNDNLPANWDPQLYGPYIKQLQGVGRWVKGVKVFEEQGLIVAWKKEYSAGVGSKDPGLQDEPALVKIGKIKCTRDQILFYSLKAAGQYQQGEIWSRYYDSSIREDFITDLLVFKEQKFFVTAHNFGDIHLRKLVEFKNIEVDGVDKDQVKDNAHSSSGGGAKSIHIFKGHSRKVTSLAPIPSKGTYFVSASLDGKLRIWCIEKMIELYCFDISVDSPVQNSALADSIMNVKLINHKIYAMIFKSFIEIGLISHLASSYYISKQPIRCLGKCFKTNQERTTNNPYALFISFDDDSIVLLNPLEPDVILSTIYPPPTCNKVVKVFYCTSIQRMFLLLATGSICVYHVEKETGTLEKLKESKSLKDYEGKPMSQGITCLDTCYTRPPQHDCEIFSDLHKYREPELGKEDYEFVGTREELENDLLDTFLVIGLSKGTIVFVRVNNLDHIYARFSIHRQAIQQIHEVKEHKIFLSICEELQLMIWGFAGKREQIYQKFDLGREVFTVAISKGNQLLMCFKGGDPSEADKHKAIEGGQRQASKKAEQFVKGGDSEILLWDPDAEREDTRTSGIKGRLKKIKVDKSDEHEVPITCCDTLKSAGLFVSGDQEGLVKIWNCRKQLIREIKFVEPVNSVAFLNPEADIIVGHSGNLSRLDAKDYMERRMTVKEYTKDSGQPDTFQQFLQKAKCLRGPTLQETEGDTTAEEHESSSEHLSFTGFTGINKGCAKNSTERKLVKLQPVEAKEPASIIKKIRESKPIGGSKSTLAQISVSQTPRVAMAVSVPYQPLPTSQQQALSRQTLVTHPAPHPAPAQTSARMVLENTYDMSQSNTGSQNHSVQKAAEFKQQLNEFKNNCVRIPSVPVAFMKNRKRLQAKEKQIKLMNSSTRRMMTENRIARNIQKRNIPTEGNKFHDILVSHSASHGSIQMGFGIQPARGGTANPVAYASVSRGNQMTRSSHFQQKDAQVGQGAHARVQGNSQLSESLGYQKGADQSKEVHTALKLLANSANTFSIFDHNSYDTKALGLQLTKFSSAPKDPAPGNFKNQTSPSSKFVILKEQNADPQKPGSANEVLHRQAASGNQMQSSQHRISEVRKSDELSLKTINQNINESQGGEHQVTENLESPLKTNIYAASTLQRSQNSKVRGGESPDTALYQKALVGNFIEHERKDASKLEASSNDNSPFYTMTNQNARLEQQKEIQEQKSVSMLPQVAQRSEKDAQKLSISLHSKPQAAELNQEGSQVAVALDGAEKVDSTMDQLLQDKDHGVITGQVQLEHGQVALHDADQAHEDSTHGDFKDPARNRFFEVEQVQQQPNVQHQPMPMTGIDFHPTQQVSAHLETTQKFSNQISPGKNQVQKEFSSAIRGSYRVQKSNEFVSTRLQQRAGQMLPLQPHLITNAKMKGGPVSYFTQHGKRTQGPRHADSKSPTSQKQYVEVEGDLARMVQHTDVDPEQDFVPSPKISRQAQRAAANLGGIVELRVTTSQENRSAGTRKGQIARQQKHDAASSYGNHPLQGPFDSQRFASQRTGARSNHFSTEDIGVRRPKVIGEKASEYSPENFDHKSLARSLLQTSDHLKHSAGLKQPAYRQTGIPTQKQALNAKPIYIQSMIPNGVHMPSKGLYNHNSRGSRRDVQVRKPRTAGGEYGGRRARTKHLSMANAQFGKQDPGGQVSHPFSGTTRLASGIPQLARNGPSLSSSQLAFTSNFQSKQISTYKQKMESIAMIGNLAHSTNPTRRNESAHQRRHSPFRTNPAGLQLMEYAASQHQPDHASPGSPQYQTNQAWLQNRLE